MWKRAGGVAFDPKCRTLGFAPNSHNILKVVSSTRKAFFGPRQLWPCLRSKMRSPFGVLAIIVGFCVTLHAAVQEPNSIISLDANGTVRNGSTAYYNRTTATLVLQLKMLIHKHSNRKHQPPDAKQSTIMYRIELALVDHAHLTSDSVQSNYCKKALAESAAACTDRHLFTPSYQQRDNGSEVNMVINFDHVYSGCYKLKIKCCTNRRSCDHSCGNRVGNYEYHLGQLETHLQNVNVSRMNISMRLSQAERGAEVELSVNYFQDAQKILKFKEFDVEIKDYYTNHTIAQMRTTSKVVHFPNCSDINVTCSHAKRDPKSHQINPSRCLCLPVGNYTIAVNVVDSRCNHQDQVCASYYHPCKRFTNRPVLIDISHKGGSNHVPPEYITISYFTVVGDFLIPLLILLIIVSFLMLFYLNRHLFVCGHNNKYTHRDPSILEETLPLPLTSRTSKVILVYDMTDDSIKERACSLRRQFLSSGVSIVYDAGDPEQEEDVVIRGEIHWFNGYISDPEVRVVVIQSKGMVRCHQELNRSRNDRHAALQELEGLSSLLFMLSQLIAIAASSTNENCVYGRIFVATYDDSNTAINPLTPYRCYKLPEHYHMLISQLLMHMRATKSDNILASF